MAPPAARPIRPCSTCSTAGPCKNLPRASGGALELVFRARYTLRIKRISKEQNFPSNLSAVVYCFPMYNVSFRPIDVCYCKEFWLATAWFLGGLLNHFKSGKELSTFSTFNTHASSYCPSRFSISSDLNYYTGWLFCLFPQLLELGLHHHMEASLIFASS
jgi:hypothetical protein